MIYDYFILKPNGQGGGGWWDFEALGGKIVSRSSLDHLRCFDSLIMSNMSLCAADIEYGLHLFAISAGRYD